MNRDSGISSKDEVFKDETMKQQASNETGELDDDKEKEEEEGKAVT